MKKEELLNTGKEGSKRIGPWKRNLIAVSKENRGERSRADHTEVERREMKY